MHGLPTLNQTHDAYLRWQESGQPSYMPGRVLPLDGFDDPPTYPAPRARDQQAVIERLRRRMQEVVTSVSSGSQGVFQVSLRIFNPDPVTRRQCKPAGPFLPEMLPDPENAPFVDDVPEIQLNPEAAETENDPMITMPAAETPGTPGTRNGHARALEPDAPETLPVAPAVGAGGLEHVERRVHLIRDLMASVMKEGEHYGKVPGCGDKMVLLKSGAEKLRVVFGLGASFKVRRHDLPGGHREYEIRCILKHLASGRVVGEGMGCCSTMESKYRWRKAERVCPHCGQATIIKGRAEYGGGWVCFKKKGGCGAKFSEDDVAITGQEVGRVENPDLADTYNTVLKIAEKRAAVDATLNATGASDLFTQDLDDRLPDADAGNTRAPFDPAQAAAPATEPEAALTRDDLLRALQARGMDGGQARSVYGWFGKQTNWKPTEAQNRQFLADIEAGRFDGGEIRPRQQAA